MNAHKMQKLYHKYIANIHSQLLIIPLPYVKLIMLESHAQNMK